MPRAGAMITRLVRRRTGTPQAPTRAEATETKGPYRELGRTLHSAVLGLSTYYGARAMDDLRLRPMSGAVELSLDFSAGGCGQPGATRTIGPSAPRSTVS